MSAGLAVVYAVRHGETAWGLSGQHTGLTDLPLTEAGERNARGLAARLAGRSFAQVLTSPLQRASHLRAGRVRRRRRTRPRPGRVELRRLRGPEERRDPRRASGLAAVPRRLPRRRIAGRGRRPRGSRGAPSARHRRRRAALFERAFPAHAGRALARARARRRSVFPAGHGGGQHPGLRAQPVRAGDPALERDPEVATA